MPRLRTLLESVLPGGSFEDFEVREDFSGVDRKIMRPDARRVLRDDGTPMVLLTIEDVTEKVQARGQLHRLNWELEDRVRDGQEALDYLFGTEAHCGRDAKVLPQAVLLDLKLPTADGLKVLRRLRADPGTRRLPVVVLTSSREEQDLTEISDLGANSYVPNPADFARFAEAIQPLPMYRLVVNEAPLHGR